MSIDIKPRVPVRSRYFTLPVDVLNPHRDRRCRHGLRGVHTFKAGSTVQAVDHEQRYTLEGREYVSETTDYHVVECSHSGPLPPDLASVLAEYDAHDWAAGPTNLKQAAAEKGVTIECLCEYAVKQLLAAGSLKIEDVLAAYDAAPIE
jgi:hypothetical protein